MVKAQPIHHQYGSLLAEWIIAISLFLLLISMSLPIVTTPSRYTLNGSTEEVVYMLKKVQLWSMLGHKSNGKGRMLFILNKDSYTLEEDAHHHTVNISLPAGIENVQPLFYGIEKVVREIVYGYLYKRDVFDGKKYTKGFMYGDALVSTAIIMFILPVILSVFWMATLTIYKAYYWDHILQDTITYVEESKSTYYQTGHIQEGIHNSQFIMSPSESITYKSHVEPIVENGIVLQRLTVQAIDNKSVVYTLSLDLEEIR